MATAKKAKLDGANLRGVSGKGAYFGDASLQGTHKTCFQSAKLVYADLSHTDATDADFSMANARGARVHALTDKGAAYDGAITLLQRKTDGALLAAEKFNPAMGK